LARLPNLKPELLTDRQRAIATELGATRGGRPSTSGPWGLLLRNEELCERAARLGTMLRDNTSVPTRISEIAILVTARFWSAQFEWNAHAPKARDAGVAPDVIEAIRLREQPNFERADERATYDFVAQLHEHKRVSAPTYRALVDQLGEQGAVELTAIAGFYATIAMLIVAFEVDLHPGAAPPFPA
jgi:4-carboxymuconolactone decarboxylase